MTLAHEDGDLSSRVIGCAISVHKELGPGLLESTYEAALCIELDDAGLSYDRQVQMPVVYKGREIGEYRLDLVVQEQLVVELKSVERLDPLFDAQLLTYMRVGLLINFNSRLLKNGIKRLVL